MNAGGPTVPRWPRLWIAMCAAFALLRLWNIVGLHPGLWNDTSSYRRVADAGWFSRDRWAGERPPLVPLVLELTGESASVTVWFQTIASIACWTYLAWVVGGVAFSTWDGRRVLSGGLVLSLALSPPIAQWDGAVLSESLALSATALLVACALAFVTRRSAGRAAAFIGAALAWGACRDTHLWLLGAGGFALAIGLVVIAIRGRRAPRAAPIVIAVALLTISVVGTAAASVGERDAFPLSNVMAVRILPYPDRIEWFADRGMPQADALQAAARDPSRVEGTGVPAVYIDPADPLWAAYGTWLHEDGRGVYLEWLALHPDYVVGEPLRSPERVFNNGTGDWAFYRPQDFGPLPGTGLLFPPWWFTVLAAGVATVVVVRAGAWRRGAWWVGVAVAGLSVPHALLAWHGDGMEAARHALVACVQLRIGVLVLVGVAIAAWPARRAETGPTAVPVSAS